VISEGVTQPVDEELEVLNMLIIPMRKKYLRYDHEEVGEE